MRKLDGHGLRPRQVLFDDHDEDALDPRLDGGLYAVVPGEDLNPAVAQAVAQGHGRQPLVPPDVRRELLEHVFFQYPGILLEQGNVLRVHDRQRQGVSVQRLADARKRVVLSRKIHVTPISSKGYARLSLPRRVPTANPTGRRNRPETAKTPRTDHGAALPTSGCTAT